MFAFPANLPPLLQIVGQENEVTAPFIWFVVVIALIVLLIPIIFHEEEIEAAESAADQDASLLTEATASGIADIDSEPVPVVEAAPPPEVEPVAETVPVPSTPAEPVSLPPTQEVVSAPDDLTRIEGIGPKINSLLQEAGIQTFAQLAQAQVSQLQQILDTASIRIAFPDTWPNQAKLAAEGQWEALDKMQDELKGGRHSS